MAVNDMQEETAAAGGTGRRLFIHIGSHKTGTTTLQFALRNAQRRKRLGRWTYVHPADAASLNSLVRVRGSGARMRAAIRRKLLDRLLPAKGDCVISTEMLFWVHDPAQIQALADHLRPQFETIQVVAYLRRQDALALSHRKQVVTGATAYHFYGAQLKALPVYRPYMRRYFDYATKLAAWEAAFGADNVIVRRFEPKDLAGGDTVKDFFQILGLDKAPQVKRANVAWSRGQILAGLWLLSRKHPSEAVTPALLKINDSEVLRPARSRARAFLARFDDCNAVLREKYDPDGPEGFFDDDMSRYPVTGNDDPETIGIDLEALERELASKPVPPGDSRKRARRAKAREGAKRDADAGTTSMPEGKASAKRKASRGGKKRARKAPLPLRFGRITIPSGRMNRALRALGRLVGR